VGCASEHACSSVALASVIRVELQPGFVPDGQVVRLCVDDACHDGFISTSGPTGPLAVAGAPELNGDPRKVLLSMTFGANHAPAASGEITTHAIAPGCQAAMVAAARFDPTTSSLVGSTWPR
jgi:hypothetical protein